MNLNHQKFAAKILNFKKKHSKHMKDAHKKSHNCIRMKEN